MPKPIDRLWLAAYVLLVILFACSDYFLPESFARARGLAIIFLCVVGIAHVRSRWQIGDHDTGAAELRARHEIDPPVEEPKHKL